MVSKMYKLFASKRIVVLVTNPSLKRMALLHSDSEQATLRDELFLQRWLCRCNQVVYLRRGCGHRAGNYYLKNKMLLGGFSVGRRCRRLVD